MMRPCHGNFHAPARERVRIVAERVCQVAVELTGGQCQAPIFDHLVGRSYADLDRVCVCADLRPAPVDLGSPLVGGMGGLVRIVARVGQIAD